jgi:ornithine cyclodeaminase/alanine dehydrogenase-like protein (mu-crystallin family)
MPAWVNGAPALGMKWVSYFPGNFDRGLPDSTGIIILNDPEHGLPCCIMEGLYVTFLRTAACAAVAAKYLAPRPPKSLGFTPSQAYWRFLDLLHDDWLCARVAKSWSDRNFFEPFLGLGFAE